MKFLGSVFCVLGSSVLVAKTLNPKPSIEDCGSSAASFGDRNFCCSSWVCEEPRPGPRRLSDVYINDSPVLYDADRKEGGKHCLSLCLYATARAGIFTLRADLLEHALRAVGLQLPGNMCAPSAVLSS